MTSTRSAVLLYSLQQSWRLYWKKKMKMEGLRTSNLVYGWSTKTRVDVRRAFPSVFWERANNFSGLGYLLLHREVRKICSHNRRKVDLSSLPTWTHGEQHFARATRCISISSSSSSSGNYSRRTCSTVTQHTQRSREWCCMTLRYISLNVRLKVKLAHLI